MSKILVLDAGHGGTDSGAVGNGLREKDLTLDIAKRIRNKLKNYDVKVIMTRTTDVYLTLTERANIANRNNADLFISVHINAGGGTGYEDFIYSKTTQSATKRFQNNLHSGIMNQIKVTDRGKKSANFTVLARTNMPAVLTENLFIDTKADANKLKDSKFLDKVAQGHVDGILKQLGLKSSGKSTSTTTKKEPATKTNTKPTTTTKSNPVLRKGSNGDSVKKLQRSLVNKGYSIGKYGVDGGFGSDTEDAVKSLQKDAKIESDGIVGSATWKVLNSNFTKPKKATNSSTKKKANLDVDGYLGRKTITALQVYFGTTADGVISSPSVVIKALQKLLGVNQDGYMGKVTITAMQKRFNMKVADGVISKPSAVIKELQRRLNKGKL